VPIKGQNSAAKFARSRQLCVLFLHSARDKRTLSVDSGRCCCLARYATAFLLLAGISGLSVPTKVNAWSDAPLCVAQPPIAELYSRYDSDAELLCSQPDQAYPLQLGSLWNAPIGGDEARVAWQEADRLSVDAPADALLKLRLVERAMPRLSDRLAAARAELLMRLGRPDEACEALHIAIDSPDTNVAAEARISMARCLLEGNKHQGEAELDRVVKRYPRLGERYTLQLALARAREHWNDRAGAIALYRSIDLSAPESSAATEAREELVRLTAAGAHVPPYLPNELVERVERMIDRGTIEAGRSAVNDLLTLSALPAQLKGRAHLMAARMARMGGNWELVREHVAAAIAVGMRPADAQRYLPRPAAEALDPLQGERLIRAQIAGRSLRKLKPGQLRNALDLAIQYGLRDSASELLAAMSGKVVAAPERFNAAIVAWGVASDESVRDVFESLREEHGMRAAASYFYARALERVGQNDAAREEYHRVVDMDEPAHYYGTWAQARLTGLEEQAVGACQRGSNGACLPDTGLQLPSAEPTPNAERPQPLAAGPGLSVVFDEVQDEGEPSRPTPAAQKREQIVTRLRALSALYGAAYPWLPRAADLAELDRYDDAASEIGELYLAWRDARGSKLRMRAGVEAVLTTAPLARHVAVGNLRRDRLAFDDSARLALADVADLLDEPGIAVRLRAEVRDARPRAYADDVERAAVKFGIDPNLLFAVMHVESVYYRQIVSCAGAVGLMQIMPHTGMRIARALGQNNFNPRDLLDPRKNLEFGAWYLSSLIQRFDGRLPLAIAAYNGGPHNVRLWLNAHSNSMPLEAFLERIPFPETNHYVRRVLTDYAAYRAQQNLPMPNLAVTMPRLQPDSVAF